MPYSSSCLATTFKNLKPYPLQTSLFPHHGMRLPANGQVTILGSPTEIVTRGRSPSHCSRALKGLEAALRDDLITILHTPAPILLDTTNAESHPITLTTDALVITTDPCWTL